MVRKALYKCSPFTFTFTFTFSLPWLTTASYSAFNIVAVVVLGFVNTKTIERGDTD
jgi:hypothetical protein